MSSVLPNRNNQNAESDSSHKQQMQTKASGPGPLTSKEQGENGVQIPVQQEERTREKERKRENEIWHLLPHVGRLPDFLTQSAGSVTIFLRNPFPDKLRNDAGKPSRKMRITQHRPKGQMLSKDIMHSSTFLQLLQVMKSIIRFNFNYMFWRHGVLHIT